MKRLFKIGGWLVLAIFLLVLGFLSYITLTKYQPAKVVQLQAHEAVKKNRKTSGDTLNLLTWNIGYAGLGSEMDFFYEGGHKVRPSSAACSRYLGHILNEVGKADSADFIFLQEVDQHSKRSYYTDQVEAFEDKLPDYYSAFAVNYDVPFVPVPLLEPMGRVKAGQMTFSRLAPTAATRYALQGSYSWPKRLFLLDRCLLYTRYTLPTGRNLSLINLHNSAFSDAAQARMQELALLKKLMLSLYRQGDYVIVGGDWNQNPPGFDFRLFKDGNKGFQFEKVPASFCPNDWTLASDPAHATNRNVNEAFVKGKTLTTVIDFFVVSPNIKLLSVHTAPNGFVNSDHQPVGLKVRLVAPTGRE